MAVIHEEQIGKPAEPKIDAGPGKTYYPPPLETIAQNLIFRRTFFLENCLEASICGGTRCFGPFGVK